jgi:hypothetical protein
MEPVSIKYLGLFRVTKSGYLTGTLIGISVVLVALVIAYPTDLLPPLRWPWDPLPAPHLTGVRGWLYNHFYEFLLAVLALEVIDIIVTLRYFARKEAEQRVAAGRGPATPTP